MYVYACMCVFACPCAYVLRLVFELDLVIYDNNNLLIDLIVRVLFSMHYAHTHIYKLTHTHCVSVCRDWGMALGGRSVATNVNIRELTKY